MSVCVCNVTKVVLAYFESIDTFVYMFICVRSVAKVIFAQFKLIGKKKSMYNYKYYIFAYIVCVCVEGGGGVVGGPGGGGGGGGVVTVSHVKVLLFVYREVFVHKF